MTVSGDPMCQAWCVDHDPEGICRADDMDTADGWTVALTLADDDECPIVGMTHPDAGVGTGLGADHAGGPRRLLADPGGREAVTA